MRDDRSFIETYSGRKAYPLDPLPEDFEIQDIAHSLSLLCRWTGHCRKFYSVAEHSVRVSRIVPPQDALAALLHDASEGFLLDLARPIKRQEGMEFYREAEKKIQSAIAEKFQIDYPFPESVHKADNILLVTEKRDLMGPLSWGKEARKALGVMPLPTRIHPWPPEKAEEKFLDRFTELDELR